MAIGLAGLLAFVPTFIALWRKSSDTARIFIWNILFFPLADLFVLTDESEIGNPSKEDKFICESCNETFGVAEKANKLFKVCGLVFIYGIILFVVESIPVDNISYLLPRFILDIAFLIIAIVHILITLFKDMGRGKCPYCGAADFI